jgi:ribosomal protein S18 acetylase RimI-like enzyme
VPNPDPILLRPAVEADIPAIAALELESFPHPEERFALTRVRYLTAAPRILSTVAIENGRLIGWVAGFTWLRGKTPWGRVYAVAVDPHARGKKLGRRLMHDMIAALEARGAEKIFLEVRPDNQIARRLYESLGFADCRPLPDFYAPGFPALRMVRVSSPAASP